MKKLIVALALLLPLSVMAKTTTQEFTAGWGNFSEPLNYSKSDLKWSVAKSGNLSITYTLEGAAPNKLYQVSIMFPNQCSTVPATFGQFGTEKGGGNCAPETWQGVTANEWAVELGVVRTDGNGDGTLKVVVDAVAAGTYVINFYVRDGAGCNLIGGSSDCNVDFQSPGPFGSGTTVVIP